MEFSHLSGRGVDKLYIVLDNQDRARFIHDLYVFNDLNPTPNFILNERHEEGRKRECLVDIHAFCLMRNHYHLLVSERAEGGLPLFMRKMNMGYTKYFNEKYERSGALWQGKYRKVLIKRDAHFLYIPFYIHLNPLDYTYPAWRQGKVLNSNKAIVELSKYRWSSYLDYSGVHNFPSLTRRSLLSEIMGLRAAQERTIADIISSPDLASSSTQIEYPEKLGHPMS